MGVAHLQAFFQTAHGRLGFVEIAGIAGFAVDDTDFHRVQAFAAGLRLPLQFLRLLLKLPRQGLEFFVPFAGAALGFHGEAGNDAHIWRIVSRRCETSSLFSRRSIRAYRSLNAAAWRCVPVLKGVR